VVGAFERRGERLDRGRLGETGGALDEQVAIGKQAHQQLLDEIGLPDDPLTEVGAQSREVGLGGGSGCRCGLRRAAERNGLRGIREVFLRARPDGSRRSNKGIGTSPCRGVSRS
jgi:hypothetical protein